MTPGGWPAVEQGAGAGSGRLPRLYQRAAEDPQPSFFPVLRAPTPTAGVDNEDQGAHHVPENEAADEKGDDRDQSPVEQYVEDLFDHVILGGGGGRPVTAGILKYAAETRAGKSGLRPRMQL